MTEQVPSKEKLSDWLRRWYALKGELRFREAADEIERLERELADALEVIAHQGKSIWLSTAHEPPAEDHARVWLIKERDEIKAAFKNFHRLLCERFGYVHDEKDWDRDQLSLIEHIAKRPSQPPPAARGLQSIGFEPRGNQHAMVACFDTIENAQVARENFTAWATQPPADDLPVHTVVTSLKDEPPDADAEELESMRKDAARYEFLREHWPRLVTSTAWAENTQIVTGVHIYASLQPANITFDPQTLDQAIDAAMDREDAEQAEADYVIEAINRGENDG